MISFLWWLRAERVRFSLALTSMDRATAKF
jgi:hypothetical protein